MVNFSGLFTFTHCWRQRQLYKTDAMLCWKHLALLLLLMRCQEPNPIFISTIYAQMYKDVCLHAFWMFVMLHFFLQTDGDFSLVKLRHIFSFSRKDVWAKGHDLAFQDLFFCYSWKLVNFRGLVNKLTLYLMKVTFYRDRD